MKTFKFLVLYAAKICANYFLEIYFLSKILNLISNVNVGYNECSGHIIY